MVIKTKKNVTCFALLMYNFVMNSIELLAPAKNKECAFAAINAGADAVYIGAESFGARKKAGNSLEDLREIINYAHKFLVKIYITVNTLIFDSELNSVEQLIWDLYDIGADAVIFQDFSVLNMKLSYEFVFRMQMYKFFSCEYCFFCIILLG